MLCFHIIGLNERCTTYIALVCITPQDPSQCRDTLFLVDRYSYLGLSPCSETELRVMEHPVSNLYFLCMSNLCGSVLSQCAAKPDSEPASGNSGLPNTRARDPVGDTAQTTNLSRPDTSHMLPFKPSTTSGAHATSQYEHHPYFFLLGVGMNAVPGGHFPLPSEVAYLMSRIPPPHCFNVSSIFPHYTSYKQCMCVYISHFKRSSCNTLATSAQCSLILLVLVLLQGPFVNLNKLVHLIQTSDLPSSLAPGIYNLWPLHRRTTHNGCSAGSTERSGKKRRAEGRDDSDDETQSGVAPPTNDIYRARQQKRAHTVNSS